MNDKSTLWVLQSIETMFRFPKKLRTFHAPRFLIGGLSHPKEKFSG
jgi:hypothetical protein